jgi:tight adherence protein C
VTPLALIAAAGMLVAAGLVLAAYVLHPGPPQLGAALAQLSTPHTNTPTILPGRRPREEVARWLPEPVAHIIEAHLGVTDADLAILDMTRAQLAARMLAGAGAGLLAPSVMTAALAAAGTVPSFVLPAGFALGLATTLWLAPARQARQKAVRARAEFSAALRAFLTFVAQERAARGSPTEALEEASRPWQSWPFRLIHTEVLRAELAGDTPWNALRALGTRLGVEELNNLADIVSTAAEGAAVFDTLLAEARNLTHAELAADQARANAVSEQLIQPLALMAVGFFLLILVPPLLRLYQT